jgi:hypothetical protein
MPCSDAATSAPVISSGSDTRSAGPHQNHHPNDQDGAADRDGPGAARAADHDLWRRRGERRRDDAPAAAWLPIPMTRERRGHRGE